MSSIEEKAIALKSILKDVKKDLKKHENVESVPEAKTESMEEFLKWADGKNKKKVTRKALDNLSYILMDVKKDVGNPSDGPSDALDAEEDEYRGLEEDRKAAAGPSSAKIEEEEKETPF